MAGTDQSPEFGTGPPPTIPTRLPFVGRAAEVDRIGAACAATASPCFLLTGPAGVGKTRLAAEAARRVAGPDAEVVGLTATAAFREIPFGTFAPLLGTLEPEDAASRGALGQAEILAIAYDAMSGRIGDAVLVVDDVHLLDPNSALLVHLLITTDRAPTLLTIRAGERLPEPLERSWMDGAIDVVELEPLPSDDVAALCSAALGGTVGDRTALRLEEASAGNLLYLRELLHSGLRHGQLSFDEGRWRWRGPFKTSGRLNELISARLLGASPEVTRLLRFLGLAEPLPVEPLLHLCGPGAVEDAEALGFLVVTADGRRQHASLAHPLYGDVLRELGGRAEARRLAAELAFELAGHGLRRSQDSLRLAVLELRSGTANDAGRLIDAAARARRLGNLDLAVELARAAAAAGGAGPARLELLECLFWQGRTDEALTVAREIDTDSLDVDSIVRLAVNLASIQFFGGRETELALAVLDGAETHLAGDDRVDRVRAHRAELLMLAGRVDDAARLAQDIIGRPGAGVVARAVAYGALSPSLALAGRVESAQDVSDEGLADLLSHPDPPLADGAGVVVGRFLAGLFGFRLTDAVHMIEGLRADALRHPADPMLSVWSLMLGRARLTQAALPSATELLSDAVVHLRVEDPSRLLAWALGSLAQALAMSGNAVAARAAVAEMDMVHDHNIAAFALDRELGRAWAASAGGRADDARRIVYDAAADEIARGTYGTGAYAVFEAFRLGVPRRQLEAVWDRGIPLEGSLLPLVIATATAATNPAGLLACADALHGFGAELWAIDTAALACTGAQAEGDRAVTTRSLVWLDVTEAGRTLVTPATADARLLTRGHDLTTRERDLIRLVVDGQSNQEISMALFISRRTVESHLHHIYKKLGVTSRDELVTAVAPSRAAP